MIYVRKQILSSGKIKMRRNRKINNDIKINNKK